MNINYLKYFYHLFPTHVNKFYSLFHRYVNSKILQLKTSINELYSQNKSIASEITNLGKTNVKIVTFSKEISENVKSINKTIGDTSRFNSLANELQNQITKCIEEINKIDKTTDIREELDKIVQDIKKQAQQKLRVVQSAFDQHERVVKMNIWKYVRAIEKSLTAQIANKIPHLVCEIENLVGKNGGKKGGKLSSIAEAIKKFRSEHPNEYKYLEIGHVVKMDDIHEIYRLTPMSTDNKKITDIDRTLKEILTELRNYKEKITTIRDKMRNYNDTNIENYRNNPQVDIEKIKLFEIIGKSNKTYKRQLGEAVDLLSDLKMLKGLFGGHRTKFIQSFRTGVDLMTSIEYEEFIRIYHAIDRVRKKTDRIRRQLDNIVSIFDYIDVVEGHRETLEGISFGSDGLAKIALLLKGVSNFRQKYRSAVTSIIASSSGLLSELERGESRSKKRGKGSYKILLGTVGLDKSTLDLLKGWKLKLQAIQALNVTIGGIASGMSKLSCGDSQQSNGSDVEGTLEYLGKIDKTLSEVYQSTNSGVTEMEKSYNLNKTKINDSASANGGTIESHVNKINKIPDKIGKLQSKVRYNIVLLSIAKTLNETLKKMEKNLWKKRT